MRWRARKVGVGRSERKNERDFFFHFFRFTFHKAFFSPLKKVAHNDYLLKLQLRKKNLPLTAGRERMTQGRSGWKCEKKTRKETRKSSFGSLRARVFLSLSEKSQHFRFFTGRRRIAENVNGCEAQYESSHCRWSSQFFFVSLVLSNRQNVKVFFF
jgi:hypothetical protein